VLIEELAGGKIALPLLSGGALLHAAKGLLMLNKHAQFVNADTTQPQPIALS